jgi:methyl-accepting chemotaxis protein
MKNASLKFKLFLLSGFLLMLSVLVGGIGYWSTSKTVGYYTLIAETNLPNMEHVEEMFLKERLALIEALRLAQPGRTVEEKQESLKVLDKQWSDYAVEDKAYNDIPFGPGEEEVYNAYHKVAMAEQELYKKALELYHKAKDEGAPEFKQFQNIVSREIPPVFLHTRELGHKLRDYHSEWSKRSGAAAKESVRFGTILSLGSIAIGGLAGMLFAFFFANGLVKTLRSISTALSDASAQVSAAAGQVASASEELSQAATEQASSLEETAASIEEMSSMVSKNNENSRSAAGQSDEALQGANKGKASVDQMINSMREINESNAQIAEIVKVIREIDTKTKVINDIVFQTRLLSFNASVEAARAGEHGKGFAVVAEEVGNLAEMSGGAAEEISGLLESSIQKVDSIVNGTKARVEQGTAVAQDCGSVLDEIVRGVSGVTKTAGEISTACNEQAQGVQEITKAMNQLDQVTQQNAATSEEAASAAEELSAQAESLNSLVNTLVCTVDGGVVAAPAAVAVPKNAAPPRGKVAKAEAVETANAKVVRIPRKEKKGGVSRKAVGAENAPDFEDDRFHEV